MDSIENLICLRFWDCPGPGTGSLRPHKGKKKWRSGNSDLQGLREMLFCHQLLVVSTPTPEPSVNCAGHTIFLYLMWHMCINSTGKIPGARGSKGAREKCKKLWSNAIPQIQYRPFCLKGAQALLLNEGLRFWDCPGPGTGSLRPWQADTKKGF